MFSNVLAFMANIFSGFDNKATIILWFDDIECPKELIQ